MKILITGGGGFIASSVIDIALNKGYEVVAFDNNHKSTCDTLLSFITHSNFKFIKGDICEPDDMVLAYAEKPDVVLHSAAIVGFPACLRNKSLARAVNIDGTRNVLYYKPPATKLVFCSTGSVYKPGQEVCDENAIAEPPSFYGFTKIRGEQFTLEANNSLVLRFGTAMGTSKNNIRVNLLANDLTFQSYFNRTITLFEHTFLRSFVHVRDISSAIIFSFENFDELYRDKSRIFNVSNNNLNFTKGELAEMIAAKLGTNVCYAEVQQDKDKRNYLMKNDKFYSYGWRPQVDMDSTLEELIKVAPLLSTYEKYQ